jgi:septum formation inhibitor MinC
VATDTIYSDTPAIDCGITSAQLFVGTKTHTADVYPIKSDKQFVNTLLDNITQRGTPTKLISDRTQVEISERVKQVLRPLHISTWQSEPHQQHQNPTISNLKLSRKPKFWICVELVPGHVEASKPPLWRLLCLNFKNFTSI